MRKSIPACLALALALALCPASAAPSQAGRERVRFEHLSTRQGLSRAVVYDILQQDSRGFMWFALEGALNRYDGISFRVYEPDPDIENSIGSDSGTFRRYVHDPSDPRSPGYDPVYDVCYAGDGKLWVGVHGGGFCRMDPASETYETFAHDPSDPYSPSNNDTHPLLVDRVGRCGSEAGAGAWTATIRASQVHAVPANFGSRARTLPFVCFRHAGGPRGLRVDRLHWRGADPV